jgi:hypothetical protein
MIPQLRCYLLIAIILITSCRKETLEGDELRLAGKWNWIKSTIITFHGNIFSNKSPYTNYNVITPLDYGSNHSIEFTSDGEIIYSKNGEEEKRRKFELIRTHLNQQNEFSFYMQINWKKWEPVAGVLNSTGDTMKTSLFYPESTDKNDVIEVESYYVKAP